MFIAVSLVSFKSKLGVLSAKTLETTGDGVMDESNEYRAILWSAPAVFPARAGPRISFIVCSAFASSASLVSILNRATAFERVTGFEDFEQFITTVVSRRNTSSTTLFEYEMKKSDMTGKATSGDRRDAFSMTDRIVDLRSSLDTEVRMKPSNDF